MYTNGDTNKKTSTGRVDDDSLTIRINGEDTELSIAGLPRFTDLVELIKASIDPDHIITSLRFDDRDVLEQEWSMNPAHISASVLEVSTGTAEDYVADNMRDSAAVVRSCYYEFRDARKSFQDGDMYEGNSKLKIAVNTLKAFFEWYGTLIQLVPQDRRENLDITPHVVEISDSCKKICQQQLYQSWWALGESLEKDLEPKLDRLEDVCRRVSKVVDSVPA